MGFVKSEHRFLSDVRVLWREAGDYISRQYTGTESTISSVSENMKEGFWGKINHKITSAQRLVKNTVTPNQNQAVIDTILGKHGNSLQNYEISKKLQNYIDYELM